MLQVFTIGYFVWRTQSLSHELNNYIGEQFMRDSIAQDRLSMQKPVIMPKEKLVVFPELNVALPYNDVTKTLSYTYDPGDGDQNTANIRVSSTLAKDPKLSRQIDCTSLTRVNLNFGSAYSPWEEESGSVELGNGQKIFLVKSRAYKNNEGSTEECASEVWTQITPEQVVAEFKKAQSL